MITLKKRKIANCICRRKKKEWLNDKIKQIGEANRRKTVHFFIKKTNSDNSTVKTTMEK
jgi:hypothetical protein